MRKLFKIILSMGAVLCLYAVSPPSLLWQGSTNGYTIQWSTVNLTVKSGKKTILDLAAWAKNDWNSIVHRRPHDLYYDSEYYYELSSVVGSVLSVKQDTECDCGGPHPWSRERFRAINLSKSTPEKPAAALLTDFFSSDEVLKTLLNDRFIKKAVPSDVHVITLQQLVETIAGNPVQLEESSSCTYAFGTDLLESFAFYDYDGQNVSVRLSLPDRDSCRGPMSQIGIKLSVPATLRKSLEEAQMRRAGFLMKNKPTDGSPEKATSILFSEPHIKVPTQ